MSDTASTRDLATWFGLTRARILDVLAAAGVEPVGRGARGVMLWPRLQALAAIETRHAEQRAVANHTGVVYAEGSSKSAQKQAKTPASAQTDRGHGRTEKEFDSA